MGIFKISKPTNHKKFTETLKCPYRSPHVVVEAIRNIIKDKADIRKFSIEVDSDTRYDLDDFIYNYDSDLIEQDEIVECKPWKFDGELNEVIYD